MATKTGFLEALEAVTEADLAAIDEEIAAVEARLDKLQSARKAVAGVLGIPTRKRLSAAALAATPPASMTNGGILPTAGMAASQRRKEIAQFLAKEGAQMPHTIAARCHVAPDKVEPLLSKHAWFGRNGAAFHITSLGREEAVND